jgi:hypothetical protein
MYKIHASFPLLVLFSVSILACVKTSNVANQAKKEAPSAAFVLPALPAPDQYWYQGKAELTTYDVEQERYGEIRKANQVNIFVTEDFSNNKQVKLDDPAAAGDDRVPVLKLNAVRKFNTGIYDYSLMSSVFTPMTGASSLKTTTTVQDWCGHVFAQLNNRGQGTWKGVFYSYFESEGDQQHDLSADYLEDELWTLARINPAALKAGKVRVVPSSIYLRLRHKPIQPEDATLAVNTTADGLTISLQYVSIERSLVLHLENKAPWRIKGWEERSAGKLHSKGTLKALRMEPYWQENSNTFEHLRDSLLLPR